MYQTAEDHICCSCGSDDDFHYPLRFPKRQLLSPTKFLFTTHLTLAITILDCLLSYAKSTPIYFTLNITPTHISRKIFISSKLYYGNISTNLFEFFNTVFRCSLLLLQLVLSQSKLFHIFLFFLSKIALSVFKLRS